MAHMTGYPILSITPSMVKLMIVDREDQNLHVLSYYEEKHKAIKNGNLVDANELIEKIKLVYEKTNYFLISTIQDAILIFPEVQSTITRSEVGLELANDSGEIELKHIKELFRIASKQIQENGQMLVNIFPIHFSVGGIEHIENPTGLIGEDVILDSFAISVSNTLFMNILHNVEQAGIQVLDIYSTFHSKIVEVSTAENLKNGIIIDIDHEHTMFSIFHNGIPIKNRMLKKGIKPMIEILSEKYQISDENAYDLLRSSVYFDEATAEDIVVYQLELPTGVLDITERDLAQTLSGYIQDTLNDVKGMLEHFNNFQSFPLIFVGQMVSFVGFKELINRVFPGRDIVFHKNDIVGLREFNSDELIGCAKLLKTREKLFKQDLQTAKTEEQATETVYNKKKKEKAPVITEESKKERNFWDKITTYFFD